MPTQQLEYVDVMWNDEDDTVVNDVQPSNICAKLAVYGDVPDIVGTEDSLVHPLNIY